MSTVRNLSTEMDASGEWKQEGRNVDSFRVGAHTDSLHCCAKPQSVETHSWLFWRMEKSQGSNWGSFYYVQIPGWGQLLGSQMLDLGAVEDAQVCTFLFFEKSIQFLLIVYQNTEMKSSLVWLTLARVTHIFTKLQ